MVHGPGLRRAAGRAVARGAAALGRALSSKRLADSQHPETPGSKKVGAGAAGQEHAAPLVVQPFTSGGGSAGPSLVPQPQVAQSFDFKARCGRCGVGNCLELMPSPCARPHVHRSHPRARQHA